MYLKCPVTFQENTYMYLDILHVFYTYPKRVQDTFWDTYQKHQDICILHPGIHAGYMRDTYGIHVSAEVRGYMEDTCGIHEGYIMRYMYLNCIQRGTYLQMVYERDTSRYIHDTFKIHHDTRIHQDTYPITTPPKLNNKPPVTPGRSGALTRLYPVLDFVSRRLSMSVDVCRAVELSSLTLDAAGT